MKKLFLILVVLFPTIVSASTVNLNQHEKEAISKLYFDGYEEYLTDEEYNLIFNSSNKFDFGSIKTEMGIMPLGNEHATTSKQLTIKSACDTDCLITIKLQWKKLPIYRSYDLIGAHLGHNKLLSVPVTNVNGALVDNANIKYDYYGFGTSVKLPKSVDNIVVMQTFIAEKGTTIHASYQHVKKNITLEDSKKYAISLDGYGRVFLFDNSVSEYYDAMGGVDIQI